MSRKGNRMSVGLQVDRLPGVGPRYELATIDGQRLTVVIDRQGDRHVSLSAGGHVEDPGASAVISAPHSSVLALILTGARGSDPRALHISTSGMGGELLVAAAASRSSVPQRLSSTTIP